MNKLDRKLPPIHSEWLLVCQSKNRMVPFQDYLLSKVKTQILTGQFQESLTKSITDITLQPTVLMKKKPLTNFDLFAVEDAPVNVVERFPLPSLESVQPISTPFLTNISTLNRILHFLKPFES